MKSHITRRAAVKSTVFGLLSVSIPNITFANTLVDTSIREKELASRYPSIKDDIVNEVVGKSHFDLDTVKKLVDKRPELARATWDWGFGDWESAIGAASHVGRRDIVSYLMRKGARPTLFTYAMLGCYEVVKSVIEHLPKSQTTMGPHGISLLSHAKAGLRMKESLTSDQIINSELLINYLEGLGNADSEHYLEITKDKSIYLGDYKYGDEDTDGFSVKLNMRDDLALGKLGKFGGALQKVDDNKFIYNGTTSVFITFQFQDDRVISLTVTEPDLVLVAKKIN